MTEIENDICDGDKWSNEWKDALGQGIPELVDSGDREEELFTHIICQISWWRLNSCGFM